MDQLKAKIDVIGMEQFTNLFLGVHENEKYIFNPEEFVFYQPKEVTDAFHEVYYRELKLFHQRMLQQMMPKFTSEGVAKVFQVLSEGDIPKERIEKKLDEVIASKAQ